MEETNQILIEILNGIREINKNIEKISDNMVDHAILGDIADPNGHLQNVMNDLSYAITNCKIT